MKEIILNSRKKDSVNYQKYTAIIDDEDVELVSQYMWFVKHDGNTSYATAADTNMKKKELVQMSRLIMGCVRGDKKIIDHIDGNGLNNQKSNLRIVSLSENQWNRRSAKNSTYKYLGVSRSRKNVRYFSKKKKQIIFRQYECWQSQIKTKGVGRFKDEESAAKAYNEAAIKHHGEFARLNIIA